MSLIRDVDRILLDTSPFCNFAEADELRAFADYLGPRGWITQDVFVELSLRVRDDTRPAHARIATLQWRDPAFPQHEPIALDANQARRVEDIQRGLRRPGDPPFAHLGEAATVVAANALKQAAVLLDDKAGRRLAKARGLPLFHTGQLAAEMVASGHLGQAVGLQIYRQVHASFTKNDFEVEVQAATKRAADSEG